MKEQIKRIGVNFGGGQVPGLNSVIRGIVMAAGEMGWEVVGIYDGYEGLLFPERYPKGGTVLLTPQSLETVAGTDECILGTASRTDPFHVRKVSADGMVEEADRSDELLRWVRKERIDAVISIADAHALSILWKLQKKGLRTVCVPKSTENQVAATMLSFGFNSTLSLTTELLDQALQNAKSARQITVVEVPGEHAGWLALQSAIAVCADAVLIPEVPADIRRLAAKLRENLEAGKKFGLVVVAQGVRLSADCHDTATKTDPLKALLSPGATGPAGTHVIESSGAAAETVAMRLQGLLDQKIHALVLGGQVKSGPPTAVDRQLGLGYGAAAVRAIRESQSGVMVTFQPPDLKFVPLADAINKIRTVPAGSVFLQIARLLGISVGD